MRAITLAASILLGVLAPGLALAGSADIVVEQPWSRASIGTARPGVAYMTIRNNGTDPVTLTGIETDVAMMPMVHKSTTDAAGTTSMEAAGNIEIPPGGTVALEPGGFHAMLMHLTRPLDEGSTFHLTLDFDDGGKVDVEVPVLAAGARGPGG